LIVGSGCSDPPDLKREIQTQVATESLNPLSQANNNESNEFERKLNKLLGQPIPKYTEDHRFYSETLVQLKDLEQLKSSEEDSINKVIELFELLGSSDKEKIATAQGQLGLEIDGGDGPQTMAAAGGFLKGSLGELEDNGESINVDELLKTNLNFLHLGFCLLLIIFLLLAASALNAWVTLWVLENNRKGCGILRELNPKINQTSEKRREDPLHKPQPRNYPHPENPPRGRQSPPCVGKLVSLFNQDLEGFDKSLKHVEHYPVCENVSGRGSRGSWVRDRDVILEKADTGIGDFWIVEIEGSSYLFPTQDTIGLGLAAAARALFQGFQAEETHFELVQPAKVSAIGGNWKLDEQGKLRPQQTDIDRLTTLFNNDPEVFEDTLKQHFEHKHYLVSENQHSDEADFVLETAKSAESGEFWIVETSEHNYLFPFAITTSSDEIAEALFEGFQQRGHPFELLKPAQVVSSGRNRNWKLHKRGRLRHI